MYENKERIKGLMAEYLKNNHGIYDINKPFKCLGNTHLDTHPSMRFKKDKNYIHCFSCNCTLDIFQLIGIDFAINDFKAQYKKALEIFGIMEKSESLTEEEKRKRYLQYQKIEKRRREEEQKEKENTIDMYLKLERNDRNKHIKKCVIALDKYIIDFLKGDIKETDFNVYSKLLIDEWIKTQNDYMSKKRKAMKEINIS